MKKIIIATLFTLLLLVNYVVADHTIIKLNPRGDDEYTLEFFNRQDTVYRFPYITNEGGTFKYGDDNKDLVFIEGNYSEGRDLRIYNGTAPRGAPHGEEGNYSEFNIGILDYFVLSGGNEGNITTHIVRYNSIDTSDRTLSFDEEGSGTKEFTYESLNEASGATIGKARLVFGSNTYITYIGNATHVGSDNPLAVDMNADGEINMAEIQITTDIGSIIDLGFANNSNGGHYEYAADHGHYWTNAGRTIQNNISPFDFLTKRHTIRHQPHRDELVHTIIEQRPNNQIGIQSVIGSRFVLAPPTGGQERTHYGFLFDLFVPGVGNDAEIFTITYLRRDPRN